MSRSEAHIEIEGLREFQAALKQRLGRLPAELGEAHKSVGEFVISKLPHGDPHAVGEGYGSAVRASATKREVVLRVGYGGRGLPLAQWGKQQVQPFRSGRPYIVGTIEANQPEIEFRFMRAVMDAVAPAFYSFELREGVES